LSSLAAAVDENRAAAAAGKEAFDYVLYIGREDKLFLFNQINSFFSYRSLECIKYAGYNHTPKIGWMDGWMETWPCVWWGPKK